MPKLRIIRQKSRKYSVLPLLLVTILSAIVIVVVGLQLNRDLSSTDSSASIGNCADVESQLCPDGDLTRSCLGPNLVTCTERVYCFEPGRGNVPRLRKTPSPCPSGQSCTLVNNVGTCTPSQPEPQPSNVNCDNATTQQQIAQLGCQSNCNPADTSLRCGTGANAAFRIDCIQLLTNYFRVRFVSDSRCPIQSGGGEQPTNPDPSPTNPPATSTTTTSSTCSGSDRANGCACVRNNQCISGLCNTSGICARPPECNGQNRPNGCQCGNNNQCNSGNCQLGNDNENRCRPISGCGSNPGGRVDGCFCVNDGQCASGLCDERINTCLVAQTGSGVSTTDPVAPNPNQGSALSGNNSMDGATIPPSNGTAGTILPDTGLFDNGSTYLLIGLGLILIGLLINRFKQNKD